MMPFKSEMVVAQIDTREPEDTWNLDPLRTERATLPTGDFRLKAAPDACVIERKTATDLLGCIGNDRTRFEKELVRIRSYPARLVLVEAAWHDVLNDPRCKISAASITGTIAAWTARYCPFHFAGTRSAAEDFARRFLFNEARRLWAISENFRREVEE